jgi:hypothetical protein
MQQTSLQTTLVDRNTVYNNVCIVFKTSKQSYLSIAAWCGDTGLITVKSGTGQQTSREKKVVLLRELHRAVVYITALCSSLNTTTFCLFLHV